MRSKVANGPVTAKFFTLISPRVKEEVLANIANNYGITRDEALAEVTGPEAEHLLDYVTGSQRAAVRMMLKMKGLM